MNLSRLRPIRAGLVVFCGVVASSLGTAQSGSFLQGIPSGFVFSDGSASGGGATLLKNSPYDGKLEPPSVPGIAATPIFDVDLMFPDHIGSVKLDGISTGNDLVPILPTGEVTPASDVWVSLNFSVRTGAQGRPGSTVKATAQGPLGPQIGACMFALHTEDSNLPTSLPGKVYLEHSPDVLRGIPSAGGSGSDISAYDTFIELIANAESPGEVLYPMTTRFFFTVTPGSAAALNQHSTPFIGPQTSVHESSIYGIEWIEYPAPHWGKPVEIYSYSDLNLPVLNQDDVTNSGANPLYANVDAIGVNTSSGSPSIPALFFSVEITPQLILPYPQVHYLEPVAPGVPTPLPVPVLDSDGVCITVAMGLDQIDDLDAICFNDPDAGSRSRGFGMPLEVTVSDLREVLGISTTAVRRPGGQDLVTMVAGFDRVTNGPGHLQMWAYSPGLDLTSFPPIPVHNPHLPVRIVEFIPHELDTFGREIQILATFQPTGGAVYRSYAVAIVL